MAGLLLPPTVKDSLKRASWSETRIFCTFAPKAGDEIALRGRGPLNYHICSVGDPNAGRIVEIISHVKLSSSARAQAFD
jgi:hypothetical protein